MSISSTTAAAASATKSPSSGTNPALSSLSGNLTNFLSLLMTQLKHQDPTAPMDTNTFTNQLVQYSSVEQQINTNTNLTNLITATQSNTILQSSALVGKQVTATNDHLTLQNSQAKIHFTAPSAEPLNISITSATGESILQTNFMPKGGNNDWSWNGKNTDGRTVPDGSYKVSVSDQTGTALTTTVTGVVTGMQRGATGVNAVMGSLQTEVGTIQSVVAPSS
ncbi:MAG: flagellar biosynthesis protein FlgD [Pseudomonadota bacterium]|nr:flagellar biosynthesis protein FlgD [Pseudomonadota bacterium]